MKSQSCFNDGRWNTRSLLWMFVVLQTIVSPGSMQFVRSEKILSNRKKFRNRQKSIPERPSLVKDALENGKPIYYFGLGSNMSRKKIENRGLNDSKIEIEKMEAAFVPNYRLAFNLRGFPPIEPGMGSLEPVNSGSKALLEYEHSECHGALIQLTPENYEKVMMSEGVNGQSDQGYEEIIVDAYPYAEKNPVKAVALRARDHVRLNYDPCPSARYMSILREGAEELGLRQSYQEFLERHPVEILSRWQRKQAIFNIFFMFSISHVLKWRGMNQIQNRILFLFYTPAHSHKLRKALSRAMIALILLPGSLMGFILYRIMELLGKMPKSAKRMVELLDNDDRQ